MLREIPIIVFTGIVVGIILLIIEYRTEWFVRHGDEAPGVRSLLPGWRARLQQQKKHWPGILRIIRIEFPLVLLVWGMFLISKDPEVDSTHLLLNIAAILVFATISESLLSEPMNHVTAWLVIFGGAAALVIGLIAPTIETVTSDMVRLILAVFLTTLALIWISGAIISENAKDLHKDIDFLKLTPGVDSMIKAEEHKLLERLRAEWPKIKSNLAVRRSQAVGTFGWFVPVKFDGFTVTLGCLEKRQLNEVNAYQHQAESFGFTIVKLIQETMSDLPVRVEFKVIDAAEFVEAQSLLEPEKKAAEGSSPL